MLFSLVASFAAPWTVAYQGLLSMGFPRQEYWSGLPFPSPGDLPDPGIKPVSSVWMGRFFTTEPPGKPKRSLPHFYYIIYSVSQSCPTLCDPMESVTYQASLSMGFSRQEYWSGLPFPSPGDLPNPGIEHGSPAL